MLFQIASLIVFLFAIFVSQFPYFRDFTTGSMKTVEDFGYAFNKDGELRKLDASGAPGKDGFEFNISKDHNVNQKHYESLGDAITRHVYEMLKNEVKLIEYPVPLNRTDNLKSFIFGTEDMHSNVNKLMILIHGSGVVRAGQWARSLIINDNLKSGTQIPYVEKARNLGYAVMITNTNDNTRIVNDTETDIPNSSTPEEHATYVWQHYVKRSKAKFIAIVAHSYGGIICMDLAENYLNDFKTRVGAIAMTDSVHGFKGYGSIPPDGMTFLKQISINWVSSSDPLDVEQRQSKKDDIPQRSAGTTRHELTSYSSIESVFDFIEERYRLHSEKMLKLGGLM